MKFYIEIAYEKGLTFSTEVTAASKSFAKETAIKFAKECGFTYQVKKIKVRGV